MNLLEQIQSKIYELSKEERTRLREWFDEFDGDSWDKEFDEHAKGSTMSGEADKAKRNVADGKFTEL